MLNGNVDFIIVFAILQDVKLKGMVKIMKTITNYNQNVTALTKEKQEALAEQVKGTPEELFVLLCLRAGLRGKEARGLLWSDVHLDAEPPHLTIQGCKTNPARSVTLVPQLSEALARRRGDNNSPYVVVLDNNERASVSPHLLRHTYFTELSLSGMDE